MSLFPRLLAGGAFLCTAFSASAMKNEDVIKMTKVGLAESTIIVAIEKEPAEYDTSVDGLIELKKAGVSDAVIQKMVAAGKGASQPAAPAASAAPAEEGITGPSYTENFPKISPPMVDIAAGRDYFLRCTLHLERSNYVMTNYSRGETVPINTPVKLVAMRGDKITLRRLDGSREFTIENVPKYTSKPIEGVARMMLSAEKTPLEKLPADLANAIRAGEMRLGMNKEQVIMARGYPPAHETSSTESDRWVYWSSRFVKQTIVFNNDRLVQGRMLR